VKKADIIIQYNTLNSGRILSLKTEASQKKLEN